MEDFLHVARTSGDGRAPSIVSSTATTSAFKSIIYIFRLLFLRLVIAMSRVEEFLEKLEKKEERFHSVRSVIWHMNEKWADVEMLDGKWVRVFGIEHVSFRSNVTLTYGSAVTARQGRNYVWLYFAEPWKIKITRSGDTLYIAEESET